MPQKSQNRPRPSNDWGGAALEYVIVSTFAAVVGVAAMTFVGKVMSSELKRLADKLGVDLAPDLDNPFNDGE